MYAAASNEFGVAAGVLPTRTTTGRDGRNLNYSFIDPQQQHTADLSTSSSLSLGSSPLKKNILMTTTTSMSSSRFSPISCQDIFAPSNRNNVLQNVTDPNGGRLYARYTVTKPPFWISIHSLEFDKTRWEMMESGNYYEKTQSRLFVKTIDATMSNHIHVIDVGGNIGWYSLLSIASAVKFNKSIVVDMFEPNPRNRLRMCESLQLNNWVQHENIAINIYPVGISSTTGGTAKMGIHKSGRGALGVYNENNQSETMSIPLVSLDDLADELGWDEATILKVDVEGIELEVLEGATRFLNNGSHVQNIFLEGNRRTRKENLRFPKLVRLLVQSGFYVYRMGNWMGPRNVMPKRVSDPLRQPTIDEATILNYTEHILQNCIDQCNMLWLPLRNRLS